MASDSDFIKQCEALNDTEGLLRFMLEHEDITASSDPYYHDLTAAVWKAARRIYEDMKTEKALK